MRFTLRIIIPIVIITSCRINEDQSIEEHTLFTLMPASETGIDFENNVVYKEEFNVYTYRNFYNGAGAGIGDINNDGLADIYFCGNQESNKLYLNKGDLKFEDITDKIDFKLKLLSCHQSQFPNFSKIIDYIKNTVSKQTDEFEYCEAFRIMEVHQVT